MTFANTHWTRVLAPMPLFAIVDRNATEVAAIPSPLSTRHPTKTILRGIPDQAIELYGGP